MFSLGEGNHSGVFFATVTAGTAAAVLVTALKHYEVSIKVKIKPRARAIATTVQTKPERQVFLCDKAVQFGLPLAQLESGDPELHEFRNIGRLYSVFFNKRGVPR